MFDLFTDAFVDVLKGADKEERSDSILDLRYTLVSGPLEFPLHRVAQKSLADAIRSGLDKL